MMLNGTTQNFKIFDYHLFGFAFKLRKFATIVDVIDTMLKVVATKIF